jgi:small conductance mechanosensitive channel
MIRILLLAALLLGVAQARAQTPEAPAPIPAAPAAPAITPAEARRLLDLLHDDAKRAQFVTTLEGLAKALPAATTDAAASAAPAAPPPAPTAPGAATPAAGAAAAAGHPAHPATAPAAAPAAAAPAAEKLVIPLAPDSLGAQVLVGASDRLSALSAELADATRAVTDFPLITRWLTHVATDEATRDDILDAAWKLAVVLGAGLAVERVLQRLLRRPAAMLAERAPSAHVPPVAADAEGLADAEDGQTERPRRRLSALLLLHRLPYALGRLLLDLLPILAMATVSYALVVGTPLGAPTTTRLVILAVLNAYLGCRLLITLVRMLAAPAAPRLRLLPLGDEAAAYLLVWCRRMVVIGIFGYALSEVALLFGLYRVAHDTLLKLVVLAIHLCLVVIVLQKRQAVAHFIRGREDSTGPLSAVRRWLARVWHFIAVFYLIAMWLVRAFEVQDGFERLLRIFISTVVVVTVARLLIVATHGSLGRWANFDPKRHSRFPGLEQRLRHYHPVARAATTTVISAVAAIVLFQFWGIDSLSWFESGALGGRLVSGLINIAVTLVVSLLIWELANAAMEARLAEVSQAGRNARSARMLTLLPMLRTVLMVTILLVAALIVLSEIGVNIAPLLAGAGVVGIAVGFGSQKLVQDIITGLFLLLENAMQVGDVVTLGGLSGTVEALSLRAIRLRSLDGSVHIIPFSAVTTVTNSSRDYGYAVLDIGVGLSEEPDRIAGIVRDVARKLRAEPRWASAIRDDIEVLGIDRFVDLAYILRVRMMTLPGQRWAVARELNERIKERFDALAVDSPITSTKVLGITPTSVRTTQSPQTGQVAG